MGDEAVRLNGGVEGRDQIGFFAACKAAAKILITNSRSRCSFFEQPPIYGDFDQPENTTYCVFEGVVICIAPLRDPILLPFGE